MHYTQWEYQLNSILIYTNIIDALNFTYLNNKHELMIKKSAINNYDSTYSYLAMIYYLKYFRIKTNKQNNTWNRDVYIKSINYKYNYYNR